MAKRHLVKVAMANVGQRLFFGAPTREHAKKLAWADLKALAGPVMTEKSESELFLTVLTGTSIHVVGLDEPRRVEGIRWNGGILDEYADMAESVWPESVRPALADTRGWCWLIGVPAGRNHYYRLSLEAQTDTTGEWRDYSWLSSEALDATEIAGIKAQTDERTYRQEYEGSFESYEGRAYVYYDSTVHRIAQSHSPNHPILVCCDFNLDPCIWLLAQILPKQGQGDVVSFQGEIVQRRTDIWKMVNDLKFRLIGLCGGDSVRARNRRTVFYGDLEHGKQRSVSATVGSWEILKGADGFAGWNVEFRLRPHPRIVDRVNAVNAKLRATDGLVRLYVDPKCKFLHDDFEMVDMDMMQKAGDTGDRTHAADAAGYFIGYEWPINPKPIARVE
jgi:hypothetical protein